MLLQETPAQTVPYLIAGYAVIFGLMSLYLVSLAVRWHRLRGEKQVLEENTL